jgi:Lrp/AsnC family transcriptional regulator
VTFEYLLTAKYPARAEGMTQISNIRPASLCHLIAKCPHDLRYDPLLYIFIDHWSVYLRIFVLVTLVRKLRHQGVFDMDRRDQMIIEELQKDSSLSQRELAEKVNLSQNACWRRLQNLREAGVIEGSTVRLNREKLGLGLVVFMMVKTRHHSSDWLKTFRRTVLNVPDVIDFFRIGGEYDYMIKVITEDMASYDQVYQRLISAVELDSVTSYFSMEAIAEQRPLKLG